MVLAVKNSCRNINNRVARKHAAFHSFLYALLNAWNVIARNGASKDSVCKLVIFSAGKRLNGKNNTRVLTVTARLLLVRIFRLRLALNCLTVCNAWNFSFNFHLCVRFDSVKDDAKLQLAHAAQHILLCLAIVFPRDSTVGLSDAGKEFAEFYIVLFISRFNSNRIHWFRVTKSDERKRSLFRSKRIACARSRKFCSNNNISRKRLRNFHKFFANGMIEFADSFFSGVRNICHFAI